MEPPIPGEVNVYISNYVNRQMSFMPMIIVLVVGFQAVLKLERKRLALDPKSFWNRHPIVNNFADNFGLIFNLFVVYSGVFSIKTNYKVWYCQSVNATLGTFNSTNLMDHFAGCANMDNGYLASFWTEVGDRSGDLITFCALGLAWYWFNSLLSWAMPNREECMKYVTTVGGKRYHIHVFEEKGSGPSETPQVNA